MMNSMLSVATLSNPMMMKSATALQVQHLNALPSATASHSNKTTIVGQYPYYAYSNSSNPSIIKTFSKPQQTTTTKASLLKPALKKKSKFTTNPRAPESLQVTKM